MKRLLKKILLVILLLLTVPVSLLAAELTLPEIYGESYYAELSPLTKKLYETEGKKLILIGGSNVAFGIDISQLEKEFPGYTVCSYGLYAAIGTSVMLTMSEDSLNEGDIVVLAFEPASDTMSEYFGANAFWKCTESDPSLLLRTDRTQKSALVGDYVSYLQERLSIVRSGDYPKVEGVYARSSFDETGNLTYFRSGNIMTLGFDTSAPVDFSEITIDEDFAEQVNDYIAAAEAKGATVYLSFSPVNQSALADGWEDSIYDYYKLCRENFHCTVISDPNRYVMDSGWFYDSNFHLNTAGCAVRTHQLACDLLAASGVYAEPDFDTPEEPSPVHEEELSEETEALNAAYAEDFIFEPLGTGLRVTGLSDEGLTKTSLRIPSQVDGQPVVAFSADVFSENDILEEVILPETIESIPDAAFSGSPNLTRLVLLHEDSIPEIGENAFEGADQLKVYVPLASYSMYRDGTGCTTNNWQYQLSRVVTY